MNRPANINFLTPQENECMELLLKAQDIFDKICDDSPQSPTDSYNFGHYLDAARSAILVRGARRLDADNLLVKHRPYDTLLDRHKTSGSAQMSGDPAMPTSDPVKPGSKSAFRSACAITPDGTTTITADTQRAICETIPDILSRIASDVDDIRESIN